MWIRIVDSEDTQKLNCVCIISGDAALYSTPDCCWGWGRPFHLYSKTAGWN